MNNFEAVVYCGNFFLLFVDFFCFVFICKFFLNFQKTLRIDLNILLNCSNFFYVGRHEFNIVKHNNLYFIIF